MKVVYTKHALEKFLILKKQGWGITRKKIIQTAKDPKWKGVSRFGQETAMSLIDNNHIIRVVLDRKDDIIRIITFHIARRGKYESTL